jgi:hypothetical protein
MYIEMVVNNEKDQRASGMYTNTVFVTSLEPLAIKVNLNISFSCKKTYLSFRAVLARIVLNEFSFFRCDREGDRYVVKDGDG